MSTPRVRTISRLQGGALFILSLQYLFKSLSSVLYSIICVSHKLLRSEVFRSISIGVLQVIPTFTPSQLFSFASCLLAHITDKKVTKTIHARDQHYCDIHLLSVLYLFVFVTSLFYQGATSARIHSSFPVDGLGLAILPSAVT